MIRPNADRIVNVATPTVAAFVVMAVFLPYSLQIAALMMVGLVALIVVQSGDSLELAPGHE